MRNGKNGGGKMVHLTKNLFLSKPHKYEFFYETLDPISYALEDLLRVGVIYTVCG